MDESASSASSGGRSLEVKLSNPISIAELTATITSFSSNADSTVTELLFPADLPPKVRNAIIALAEFSNLKTVPAGRKGGAFLRLVRMQDTCAVEEEEQAPLLQMAPAKVPQERVKTIPGYQGAQILCHDHFTPQLLDYVQPRLKCLWHGMWKSMKDQANTIDSRKEFKIQLKPLSRPPPPRISKKKSHLQRFREGLPTYKHRDEIVNAVRHNDVVIVSGETGSGKTTQIPQMLYDAKVFPKNETIICTQPRRISAISVAQRVATERGEACGGTCGYVIRFENVTSSHTRLVYETTGILLRRLHGEPELRGVACVIVDEVHERDLETDFCLLLLRDRLLAQRRDSSRFPQKLKVVVMSATVQIDTLVAYFSECNAGHRVPLIRIPGTLYSVQEYFLEDAISWVGAAASSVPAMAVVAQKERAISDGRGGDSGEASGSLYDKLKTSVVNSSGQDPETLVPHNLVCDLIVHFHKKDRDMSGSILVFLPGWAAINRIAEMLRRSDVGRQLSVLMLHSSLTSAEQQRVFEPAPRMYRKVVLATSIAETSITIDDVVYVIDSGLVKGTSYDATGNTSALRATFIGKANGVQRRGRAGRCRPGTCVHLLPLSMYKDLPEFLPPEIMRSPLEEICLQIKAIQEDELCSSVLSRALDAPPPDSVRNATEFLTEMGAFTAGDERLTNLGRALAQLPVHPLLGKMLFAGACFGVLDSIATIAAGLSVKSPFVRPQAFQRARAEEAMAILDNGDLSDHLCVLKLYRGWIKSRRSFQYASERFADPNTLRQLDRTKQQLMRLVLRSPLVRKMKDALNTACRYSDNMGLTRLVLLWALYPRIGTIEYRHKRSRERPEVFTWDNKHVVFNINSPMKGCKRKTIDTRCFVMYYERMQLESTLNILDATCMTPVDVALCLRQLTVLPLADVPEMLVKDETCEWEPTFPLEMMDLGDKSGYSALLFDGDKKLYVTTTKVARALRMARECMDYYLALSIKKLRADVFPPKLVTAIARLIGYPVKENELFVCAGAEKFNDDGGEEYIEEDDAENMASGNAPAFVRGHDSADDDSDGEAPIMEDMDEAPSIQLTEEERRRVVAAFGDLAVFRCDGASSLLEAARTGEAKAAADAATSKEETSPAEEEADEECDEEEDEIVAAVGDLKLQ